MWYVRCWHKKDVNRINWSCVSIRGFQQCQWNGLFLSSSFCLNTTFFVCHSVLYSICLTAFVSLSGLTASICSRHRQSISVSKSVHFSQSVVGLFSLLSVWMSVLSYVHLFLPLKLWYQACLLLNYCMSVSLDFSADSTS